MRAAFIALALFVGVAVATPSWHLDSGFQASVAMGVAFVSDTHGYISGGDSGSGPSVWATNNAGKTWHTTNDSSALTFLAVGADGDNAVVSGFFDVEYSNDDGMSFLKSTGDIGGPCQSAEAFRSGSGMFGITGQTLEWNGVSVSVDGGKTFTKQANVWNATEANAGYDARYGAFPTDDVWYVSGGTWPTRNSDDNTPKNDDASGTETYITKNLRLHSSGRLERIRANKNLRAATPGWMAVIAKTTDGGKTFTTQLKIPDQFYFNGIDCWDTETCVVVGESDTESSVPGVRAFVTNDGGKTWNRKFFMAGGQYSMMAARMVSKTEAWISGGELDSSFSAIFMHTTDLGENWTTYRLPGAYATSLSFPDAAHGFATVMLEDDQCGFAYLE